MKKKQKNYQFYYLPVFTILLLLGQVIAHHILQSRIEEQATFNTFALLLNVLALPFVVFIIGAIFDDIGTKKSEEVYIKTDSIILNSKGDIYSENGRMLLANRASSIYEVSINESENTIEISMKPNDTTEISKICGVYKIINIPDFDGLFVEGSIRFNKSRILLHTAYFFAAMIYVHIHVSYYHILLRIIIYIIAVVVNFAYAIWFSDVIGKIKTKLVIDINKYFVSDVILSEFDSNKIHLENCQSIFNNLKRKIDSYMIEAGLFGALAFSGFIQLIINKNFIIPFYDIANEIIQTINAISESMIGEISISNSTMIYGVIVLCLFSTFCFVLVVISRLTYSDLLREMETSLNLSRFDLFNFEKENNTNSEKPSLYDHEFKKNLHNYNYIKTQMMGIVLYISFMRNLAMLLFVFALFLFSFSLNVFMGIFLLSFLIVALMFSKIQKNVLGKRISKRMEDSVYKFVRK